MNKTRSFFAFALAAASLGAVQPVAAQTLLTPPTPEKGLWIDAAYSDFKSSEIGFPSTVWYLSGRLPLTSRISAVADVPFSYARVEPLDEDAQTSSVVGNPYLGVEFTGSPRLRLELGARAPLNTADEESFADVTAFMGDPLRLDAFMEDVLPVSAAATWTQPLTPALSLRLQGGATGLFHTGDETADNDATLDYGVAGSYTAGRARLGLGLAGLWLASADDGDFAENSVHSAGASADFLVGGVRPGISVRVPLDEDVREAVNSTVGLYLQIPLR